MQALRLPDTTLDDRHPWFAVTLDAEGEVVAGLRVNGPLVVPEDAAALRELSSSPTAERRITDILERTRARRGHRDQGLLGPERGRRGTARSPRPSPARPAGSRRSSACGTRSARPSEHAAGHWREAGGVPLMSVPAVPYPTAEYSTRVHWWDSMDPGRAVLVESVPSRRVSATRINCRAGRLPVGR